MLTISFGLSGLTAQPNASPPTGWLVIHGPPGTTYEVVDRNLKQRTGTAQESIGLTPGRVDVTLKSPGFLDQRQSVNIEENKVSYAVWNSENSERGNPPNRDTYELPNASSHRVLANSVIGQFLNRQGFKAVKIRDEKTPDSSDGIGHLLLGGAINNKNAELMIDTGTAMCAVARQNLKKFDLTEKKTTHPMRGTTGSSSSDFFGKGIIKQLSIFYPLFSPITLTYLDNGAIYLRDVPVLIANIPHADGILGMDNLHMAGAVMDCKNRMLYVAPHGGVSKISEQLGGLLRRDGYAAISLRANAKHQLAANGFVNAIPCSAVIDTGSILTCIDRRIGQKAGVAMTSASGTLTTDGIHNSKYDAGLVKTLRIGEFEIPNASAAFIDYRNSADLPMILIGIRQLSSASAVLDTGARILYLK